MPRIYIPGTSGGKRVAIDPRNGTVAPVAYIGLYVPNSGNPAYGMQLLGANGNPTEAYHQRAVVPACSPASRKPRPRRQRPGALKPKLAAATGSSSTPFA